MAKEPNNYSKDDLGKSTTEKHELQENTDSEEIYVTKRGGEKEKLNLEKIHKVLEWACEGLSNVSYSTIEIKAKIQFKNGIRTDDIHSVLCRTAANLISEDTPNYQYVAARLGMMALRKEVFNNIHPPHIYKYVVGMVEKGLYTENLLEWYSEAEFDQMNQFINHNRDDLFTWTAFKQFEGKYLRQNRETKQKYETPQFLYMMVAATIFNDYPKEKRMQMIEKYYNSISTFDISLPTPIMAGLRTPIKQFSSCVLIECGDSLDSINATTNAITRYISKKAGIGVNAGAIRAEGSSIRGGDSVHTGVTPFYRLFQSAVKSCSQGGVRGGAATLFTPLWHMEIEEILVLKNNKGTDDNRVKKLDYGIQFNKLMYQRLIDNKEITLFSPSDVDGLYEAFFADQEKFEELYVQYENDPNIKKKKVKPMDIFTLFMLERMGTGRIYMQNVDLCNEFGPFIPSKAPIRQSNLCLEIALPTKPLVSPESDEGEIALCTLSAFNLGKLGKIDFSNKEEAIKQINEYIKPTAELAVRSLDAILDYQEYPVAAAKRSTMKYRPLGIGVINYAYALAKNGLQYSNDSAVQFTHIVFEAIQYWCMKASVQLAKEKGKCLGFDNTKYSYNSLPIDADRHKKAVDDLVEKNGGMVYYQDWEELRNEIKQYGIRNATLTALMPSETSSQIANATNGIEPPRNYISIKSSKDGNLSQAVPEIDNPDVRWNYELCWDMPSPKGYIKLVGVMQKFVDQTISANTSYNPQHYPGFKLPMKDLLEDLLFCYKYGVKTAYYFNTNDRTDDNGDDDCADGACKI